MTVGAIGLIATASAAGAATSGGSSGSPTVTVDSVVTALGSPYATVNVSNSTPELAVAYVSADGDRLGQTVNLWGGNLAWHLAGRSNLQMGDAEVWWAQTQGQSFSVMARPSITYSSRAELTVVTYANAGGVGAVVAASAPQGAPRVNLTPRASGSLVGGVGFDWDSSTYRSLAGGQSVLGQAVDPYGDSYWAQEINAPTYAGVPVTVSDMAPVSDRWDMTAVEVVPALSSGSGGTTTTIPDTTTTVPATTTTTVQPTTTTTVPATTTTTVQPTTTTTVQPTTTTTVPVNDDGSEQPVGRVHPDLHPVAERTGSDRRPELLPDRRLLPVLRPARREHLDRLGHRLLQRRNQLPGRRLRLRQRRVPQWQSRPDGCRRRGGQHRGPPDRLCL
jgi:hypothetical protein